MAEKEVKLQMEEVSWHRAKVAAAQIGVSLKWFCTQAILKEVKATEKIYKS